MNYTVVIVTFNRLKLLKECLKCVDSQSLKFHSIVLINNCSTDGTTDFLKDYCGNRNDIVLINTESNVGGAGGFELGVKNLPTDTDYALLIDDDAMLDSLFLEKINSHIEKGIEAYSGTVTTDGIIDTSHRRRLKNRILMTKDDVSVDEYEKESFIFDIATFCGLMVSKSVIDKVGLPKGEYFIWYDDTEYCLRINMYTKIKNVNSAHINHKTKIFNESELSWKSYYGYRNQIDVGKKYSKIPLLYCIYRYVYHRYRIISFSHLSKKNLGEKYYKECEKLHRAVLRDAKAGKLGKCVEYFPGKSLK